MEHKSSKCRNTASIVGDINGMDTVRNVAGSRECFPAVTFSDGNGSKHFTVRGGADFKTAIHIPSGAYIDPGNVPAVKIFEAGSCSVCHIADIAGKFIGIIAVL